MEVAQQYLVQELWSLPRSPTDPITFLATPPLITGLIYLSLSRCCCFPLLTANSSQSTSDTTMSGSPPSFARTMPRTGMCCGGRWTSSKNLVYDLWYHHNTEWLLTRTHMSRVYKIETDNNYNVSLGDFISLKYHILLSIAVLYSQPTLSWYQWKIFQSGQTISFNAVLNWW